jgi:hypothetical protein
MSESQKFDFCKFELGVTPEKIMALVKEKNNVALQEIHRKLVQQG